MAEDLPNSVRYIKNGPGGAWWNAARAENRIYAGWTDVDDALLQKPDWTQIREQVGANITDKGALTRDLNALGTLLNGPSQHVWITIADDHLWWCTVHDGVGVGPKDVPDRGHFWLTCDRNWSKEAINGKPLNISRLPGFVAATGAYRATLCEPGKAPDILRLIKGESDPAAMKAEEARSAYETALEPLIQKLHPNDFELVVDLILARSGWARVEKLGGVREGLDIEAHNAALDENAYVQIKSRAGQSTLDDYIGRFRSAERYHRMIFAVHTQEGLLRVPENSNIQLWDGKKISQLVVRLGLGEWLSNRV